MGAYVTRKSEKACCVTRCGAGSRRETRYRLHQTIRRLRSNSVTGPRVQSQRMHADGGIDVQREEVQAGLRATGDATAPERRIQAYRK